MTSDVPAKQSMMDRLREYLRETRIEMRKVVWPTREEAVNLTSVVLAVTLAMTVFLGGLDWFYNELFGLLLNLARSLGA